MDLLEAWNLGRALMDEHGLKDWGLRFSRAKRQAGACHYAQHLLTLSAAVTRIHPVEDARDTVLHEIAHALVGPKAGHGPVWAARRGRSGRAGSAASPPTCPACRALGRCIRTIELLDAVRAGTRVVRHRPGSRADQSRGDPGRPGRRGGQGRAYSLSGRHRRNRLAGAVPLRPDRLTLPVSADGRELRNHSHECYDLGNIGAWS